MLCEAAVFGRTGLVQTALLGYQTPGLKMGQVAT